MCVVKDVQIKGYEKMDILTLLVVYKKKDEELFEYFKELVYRKDDEDEKRVGLKDGSVKIIRCDEDTYLHHLKAGRSLNKLADKVLFIGDIKGVTPLEPIFDRYGISFGFDGTVITVSVDADYEWARYEYDEFIEELKQFTDHELVNADGLMGKEIRDEKKNIKRDALVVAGGFLFPPLHIYEATKRARALKENIDDNKIIRQQMLLYGLSALYYLNLEEFMLG